MRAKMKVCQLSWDCFCNGVEFDKHKDFLNNNGGIYIWIFNGAPPRVAYIGETKNYFMRFAKDHFQNILTGRWNTYNVSKDQDFVKFLCKNIVGKDYASIKSERKYYRTYDFGREEFKFKDHFFDDEYLSMHRKFLFNLKFAFAPIQDEELRKDIEAALIIKIREVYAIENKIDPGNFILPNGRVWRDTPFGTISRVPKDEYLIEHCGEFMKNIPEELTKICEYKIT